MPQNRLWWVFHGPCRGSDRTAPGSTPYISHSHYAAEIADGVELAPGGSVIMRDRHARRVKAGKHDQTLHTLRVHHPVDGGNLFACRPTGWNGQPIRPRETRIGATL